MVQYEKEGYASYMLVDENYKSGTIPTQQSLEWGWINQWYQGTKIGPDIYHIKPFKLLNYCPSDPYLRYKRAGNQDVIAMIKIRDLKDSCKSYNVLKKSQIE